MELTREERMQQRLRGAQRRQVKDVDFGLVVPAASAPAPPTPPTRRTPQPELPPQPSTRRTPANLIPPPPATSIPETIRTVVQSVNDANTSAKRRKLDSDIEPLLSGRSTRSSQAAVRPDIYALNDDDQQEQSAVESTNPSIEQISETVTEQENAAPPSPPKAARTPSVAGPVAEQTTKSQNDAPGSSNRIQAGPTDETSPRLQEVQNGTPAHSATEVETPMPLLKRKRGAAVPKAVAPETSRKSHRQTNLALNNEIDELSPEQPARRVRRPRITVQDKPSAAEERDPLSDLPEQEEAEAIDDKEAAILLKKNWARRKSRNIEETSPGLDEVESGLPLAKKERKQKREESSRVQQRQPKKSNSTTNFPKEQRTKKMGAGSPIPVIVHRLTRAPLYNENESDAEVLNAQIPRMKRGGVNSVDVLSQICQEVVGAALETLEEGGNNCEDPALRREYKTKWRAAESFGNEVHTRLLEHTINLDNAYSLERRVRDEQKKKLGLREEILRVRAERENVALRMDEIRIHHENETISARDRDSLNTAVHDIELAVELGKTRKPDQTANNTANMSGIELLLKRVAGKASNKGGSGGMLRQIKEFNAFLERAALVLESRRV